jgi:hypothetical protein
VAQKLPVGKGEEATNTVLDESDGFRECTKASTDRLTNNDLRESLMAGQNPSLLQSRTRCSTK